MAGLRPFAEADIKPVSDLIWKVLHERTGTAPPSLQEHLSKLFFQNPWLDEGITSRVFENAESRIVGFFGAVPRRMTIRGERIRLAFGSNLVVDPESRASITAMQLVKAFLKGTQDISITDSANDMSRPLLRSLGFNTVPIYSLLWARPLRPLQYGFNAVARLKKNKNVAVIGSIAKPLFRLGDAIATRVRLSPFRQIALSEVDSDLPIDTMLNCLNTIPSKHWMLPEYDQKSLAWILEFITRRAVFGELRKAQVFDKDRGVVGWYIYSRPPKGVGEVLQIGAESAHIGKVLDHLFYDAWKNGLIGLHGRMEPQFMQELTARSCFFFRNGSWTMLHTNKPDLLAQVQSGNAFFSRLDGEWSLRHGSQES